MAKRHPMVWAGTLVCLVAGCDNPSEPFNANVAQSLASVRQETDMDRVTRSMALALRDEGLRTRVANDMAASGVHEDKLAVAEYLNGLGKDLRSAIESAGGMGATGLSRALSQLPAMEMYFPVDAHRSAWNGGLDLIVAYQLNDDDIPQGYDLEGRPVMLSLAAPPVTPTIVLVPKEVHYAAAAVGLNVQLSNAEVLPCEPEDLECDDGGSGGGGGPPPPPPPPPSGLYIDRMKIDHDGESWPRGDPELEVHVFGTQNGIYRTWQNGVIWELEYLPNLSRQPWLACSGALETGARRFDYDNETTYDNDILLLQADSFFIDEVIRNNVGQVVLRRLDALDVPVLIRVLERDDGNQCPSPPEKHQFEAQFTYEWGGGFNAGGFGWEDISALLGGGNDLLGLYFINSFDELESASMLHKSAADVEIWLTNYGFDRADIPPDQNPYNP